MSLEQSISAEPIKEKLKNLAQYMPRQTHTTYEFAAYLADKLSPELTPTEFNRQAELALYEVRGGLSGTIPIPESLAGKQPVIYSLLRILIHHIAEAVCPKDFARSVKEFYEQMNRR
jgi:hypothetical protein